MKSKVFFRADGNSSIGLGHVMRCLSLIEMLFEKFNPVFIIQEPAKEVKQLIQKYCNDIIELPASDHYVNEAGAILPLLKDNDFLVLDGYNFDTHYQKVLYKTAKIIFIDDLVQFHFYAHAVINHAGGISSENYIKELHTVLNLGPQYALLRKSFLSEAKKDVYNKEAGSCFLNMGGADVNNDTLRTLQIIVEEKSIKKIFVVIGSLYSYKKELSDFAKECNYIQINIIENASESQMLEIMKSCEMAVCSASTVSYEYSCTRGLLFLVRTAANQKNIYNYLISEGFGFPFENFANVRLAKDSSLKNIEKQKKVFDGKSPERIIRIFEQLTLESSLNLRKTDEKDLMLYFGWRNDPIARQNSINKEYISLETHTQWFLSKLLDANSRLYILEWAGKPVGQIRFDKKNDDWEIGFMIDSNHREKGLGLLIVKMGICAINQTDGIINFTAKVQKDNKASESIFRKLGFRLQEEIEINGFEYFVFKLKCNGI